MENTMENQNTNQGIFLNGKKQIIEMLQFMNNKEKQKLLSNIKARNAVMARELTEESFSFNDLVDLDSANLNKVFSNVAPVIIGLALYPVSPTFQKKVLSSIDRATAEKAFEVMGNNLSTKEAECKKAQQKIVNQALQMNRIKTISI